MKKGISLMDAAGDSIISSDTQSRQPLSKEIREKVWKRFHGENEVGKCFICPREIDSSNWECGHIIASSEGGEDNIGNLRPICSTCNRRMGKMDLNRFKKIYNYGVEDERRFSTNKCSPIQKKSKVKPRVDDHDEDDEENNYMDNFERNMKKAGDLLRF